MANTPVPKTYRATGISWAIDGDAQGPACLVVEDEGGKTAFWWLSYALLHSSQITNFSRLSADVESGRIRLGDDDAKVWTLWRLSTEPLGAS
ncbi:hypothetical protein [Paraburkholderia sp. BL25I1N1]|uniref:hypothetical protein n=1 Tax=Paraburkholderia sp. BL25I1N1 TaxID=1938804 RepID=UPI000D4AA918|nr:hypothetical protein [Paraburkholderia sp. BL25I1N1]PRY03787.1 hypothetical protein B0G73_114108 [Paraburkholderia sp. BL25I1N1]